jgi:hypothetical protein
MDSAPTGTLDLLVGAAEGMNGGVWSATTNYPYLLFNQSPEDLRRIGARGRRAYGRNRRGRRAQGYRPLEAVERRVPYLETAAEARLARDSRIEESGDYLLPFPAWLSCAILRDRRPGCAVFLVRGAGELTSGAQFTLFSYFTGAWLGGLSTTVTGLNRPAILPTVA